MTHVDRVASCVLLDVPHYSIAGVHFPDGVLRSIFASWDPVVFRKNWQRPKPFRYLSHARDWISRCRLYTR